jgi:Zn-dependent protease with chaperone function
MERADFIHLLRLSEQASSADSAAYRRNVAGFVVLGYAWVIGCFVLACILLYWAIDALSHGRFKASYVWVLVAAGSLLITSLRALWCRFDPPEGVELKPSDAPALFEALERIRKKIKGPPIHHVWLSDDFNASISQLPRYGLLGGAVNHLSIGLPLLLAVDRPRFLAVLAHEYGHLRGDHGRFAAWVYRTRLSWARMEQSMRGDQGLVTLLSQSFLRWYFPRFAAKTFALARQDEYEADRIAGKLLGHNVAGAALIEIDLKGSWLAQEFWRDHWRAAAHTMQPVGPYTMMRKLFSLPLPEPFARTTLRQNLRRISDIDDTHPVLRDRLEALEAHAELPAWSTQSSLELLGKKGSQWLAHFDKVWCRDHASEWKQHHAYLERLKAQIETLKAGFETLNADQLAGLGELQLRLDPRAQVRPCFERAVQLAPQHGPGLRGLIQCLGPQEGAARLDYLNRLFDHRPDFRWWACNTAVTHLEQPGADGQQDLRLLSSWRERLKTARAAEERAWEELTDGDFFRATSPHDLNEFESGELQSDLARCQPVARAWLARKNLKEFASRRAYVLFVELPGMDDEDRYALCRHLEQTLDLPGPVFVLWAGENPTLRQIERQIRSPIYMKQPRG